VRVIDVIVEILKREGVEFLSCYPTTPLIDAAAEADLRPIVCRQERVGVGIADGFSRVTNGKRLGVFAMQFGPGAENAFSGIGTAFNDSVPILLLPTGAPRERVGMVPYFSALQGYAAVTKSVQQLNLARRAPEFMRRAFSRLRIGKPGPVMLEIPADIAVEEVGGYEYEPVKTTVSSGNARDVDEAVRLLLEARCPVIHAGQGVHYAEAWAELMEFAELMQIPVMTTMLGKSAFPEDHSLSLGTAYRMKTGPAFHFLNQSDVILGIGCSFSRHHQSAQIPPGKVMIHATNSEADINNGYSTDYPIIGDARLVLLQLIAAARDRLANKNQRDGSRVIAEIKRVREEWLAKWMPKLTSDEKPLNAYRVLWELTRTIDPRQAIVTHDSGSPRDQIVPFYPALTPHCYLGWGKSHALGTGLGLIIGAKLAAPDRVAINFMGDAAFGMVGLDFETAVRNNIPIITIVLNNSTMAVELTHMVASHERYRARDIGGNYADMGRALGGYAERVENPGDIAPAIQRARQVTEEEGRPVLLEFITSEETDVSML